mmetsp:Transcript_11540/g.36599  ORF Transcript_11540/g.36599 Transcript_11540/m.36599 type:complete len:178 (+) Transcript_11540:504-1037(+)
MDLAHTAYHFPKLGGADALAHHAGFIALTALQMSYDLLPVAAAWLLLGELSTLPLNLRWFLLQHGLGESRALYCTNLAFALTFLLVRVAFFWGGVAQVLLRLRPLLLAPPCHAPRLAVDALCAAITAAGCLNGWWMYKIVGMARRATERRQPSVPPTPQSLGGSAQRVSEAAAAKSE